jgi:hypothetical protein
VQKGGIRTGISVIQPARSTRAREWGQSRLSRIPPRIPPSRIPPTPGAPPLTSTPLRTQAASLSSVTSVLLFENCHHYLCLSFGVHSSFMYSRASRKCLRGGDARPIITKECQIGPNYAGLLLLCALAPSYSPHLLPLAQGSSLQFSPRSPCLPLWIPTWKDAVLWKRP